ncbi:M16 family metallopeptidase (plasmid) [Pseudoalteromonas sp. T1lg65]|uniref:M16 family metallopeptidase n=1 Tax=Pseudoalteromonas sp. T1lg65 TaxID=2077101 RepID=UPI003F7A9231
MNKLTLNALAVAVTLALSGCSATATTSNTNNTAVQQQNFPSVDINYDSFTLDNGLKVIVHTDKKAPIVAVNIWYNVGSKNEKLGKTGFAHLFEHLMFNGSENYNDEYFGPFERAGATEMNGTTNSDRTNYFQNVPTSALDMALWMESDRMGHLLGAITQEKLDEQRGVVQNEKRQGESQPYGTMWNVMSEQSFPKGHPYSWSVIGSMEDLNAASLEDVHQWFKDYYGPNNAILILAGDIDLATAKEKAQKYFGDIKPGKPIAQLDSWVAKRTGEKRITLQDRVPAARVVKSWNTAELGSLDNEYLDLLVSVLADGKNSRLYKRMVHEDKVASNVIGYNYSRTLAGQVVIMADALPGHNLDKLENIIDEELNKLLADGPTKDELYRAKFSRAAGFVKQVEGVGGFGGKSDLLARGQLYHDDPTYYKRSFEIQNGATPKQIKEAGKRWLTDGALVINVEPFAQYSSAEKGADRSQLPEVKELPKLDLPEVQTATLSNGLEVVLAQRTDTPMVNLSLSFDAGAAADFGKKSGTASFTMDMLTESTQSLSSLELAAKQEQLGASIYGYSQLDYSTLAMSALSIKWQESLALFADVLQNPAFSNDDLERVRTLTLDNIQKEKSRPRSNALRILPPLLYGENHAYGQPLTGSGTEESVTSLTREDLVAFKNTWLRPDNARLYVVGDIDMKTLTASLEDTLSSWKAPSSAKPSKALSKVAVPNKPRVFVVDKPDSPQSLIVAGLLGKTKGELEKHQDIELDVMNSIVGGTFTSRLNMNLREDKGWSYGVFSSVMTTEGQAPFLVFAPVQTDKTKESVAEILKELSAYTGDKPATSDELAKIISNKVAKLPGAYEKQRSLLSALVGAYNDGKTIKDLESYGQNVQQVTLDQVKDEANKLIDTNKLTWVIVGDKAKIQAELEALNLGEITYL